MAASPPFFTFTSLHPWGSFTSLLHLHFPPSRRQLPLLPPSPARVMGCEVGSHMSPLYSTKLCMVSTALHCVWKYSTTLFMKSTALHCVWKVLHYVLLWTADSTFAALLQTASFLWSKVRHWGMKTSKYSAVQFFVVQLTSVLCCVVLYTVQCTLYTIHCT